MTRPEVNERKELETGEDLVKGQKIRKFFDEMSTDRDKAIEANAIISYEQEQRAEAALEMLSVQPGESVLDVGCGNARDMAAVIQQGGEVVGVDISEGMVNESRAALRGFSQGKGVSLVVGDAVDLAFADSIFDKVLCSEVIEHIPDVNRAIAEMHRVLKPGGVLVITTPNRKSWYGVERYWLWEGLLRRDWPHPNDTWRTILQVEDLIKKNQLKLVDKRTVCFIPGFILGYVVRIGIFRRMVVYSVRKLEPYMKKRFWRYGYTICVKAIR